MRRTKIIITLGPSTDFPEMLEKLIENGVSIFRLNMSHAKHDWVRRVCTDIKAISAKLDKAVGLMLDTQGPEIRTGELGEALQLKPGDKFDFTVRGTVSQEEKSVDTNYDDMVNDINVGDVVLVDSGVIRMKVLSKEEKQIHCEVLTQGSLTSRRHINLPGVKVNLPALTAKDIADVDLAVELKMDYIALSFVREAQDVSTLRALLKAKSPDRAIRIIAKIEDQLAVQNFDSIMHASDGIMVARGDLGIECPYEELPIIQRRIVKECLKHKKRVIVATHMLESMIQNPMPTRAEITDVANAVHEQADAIMLSGETSVGRYPLECIQVMDRIAERIERSGGAGFAEAIEVTTPRDALINSAVQLANNIRADALLVFTRHGFVASLAGAFRPRYTPIYAFSPDADCITRLTLRWGITPISLAISDDPEQTVSNAIQKLTDKHLIKSKDKLVIITDMVVQKEKFDAIQLRIVK